MIENHDAKNTRFRCWCQDQNFVVDVVSKEKRSRMMSGIKGKNTKPERQIARMLHASGLRYRLHRKDLPAKPDLVFPKYRAVVLVHGCFWHGHDCHLFKMPQTRTEFWRTKISSNQVRDKQQIEQLIDDGWRVMVVWECAIKGKARLEESALAEAMADWIKRGDKYVEFQGTKTCTDSQD